MRLLAEKQAAIDAAVADTYERFDAAAVAKCDERIAFIRETYGKAQAYVAFIRDSLTGYIAANDAAMEAVVFERRASLTAAMADQMA